jgi:hypothetical protein
MSRVKEDFPGEIIGLHDLRGSIKGPDFVREN